MEFRHAILIFRAFLHSAFSVPASANFALCPSQREVQVGKAVFYRKTLMTQVSGSGCRYCFNIEKRVSLFDLSRW